MPYCLTGILDLRNIKPRLQIIREPQQILLSRTDNEPLLFCINRSSAGNQRTGFSCFDLDEQQPFPKPCDHINLAAADGIIPAENFCALPFQQCADSRFAETADFPQITPAAHRIF